MTNNKKIFSAILTAIVCCVTVVFPSQVGAVDGEVNYSAINTLIYGDDGHTDGDKGPFNIGFAFNFYGANFTQAYVNINGALTFNTYYSTYSNTALSNSSAMNNSIFAFWDDLITDPTYSPSIRPIYYATIGEAPNRKFVTQWTNIYFFSTDIQMGTFQVILYEGSNIVQIQYRDLLGGARALGNSATIGIKKDNSTYSQYSNNTTNAISQEQAIRYTPNGGGGYTVNTAADYDLIYLVPEGAPISPTLVNPTDETTGITTSPTFEWLPVENATSYTVLVSTAADFSSTVINESGQTGTSYTYGSALQSSTQYYWRVQSVNGSGSALSPTLTFTTGGANTAPNLPSNVSSANLIGGGTLGNPTGSTLTATLSDPDESEQVRFRIQIASNDSFGNLVIDYRSPFSDEGVFNYTFGENNGTYLVGGSGTTLSAGNYYLRIRAEDDAAASSDWSTAEGIAFVVPTQFRITSLGGSHTAINISNSADMTQSQSSGSYTIRLSSGGVPVSDAVVSLTSNLDWSGVTASATGSVSVVYFNPSQVATHGHNATLNPHILYITKGTTTGVRVCPDAQTLEQVTSECSNGVSFTNGETKSVTFPSGSNNVTLGTETINSTNYWKVSGLLGSGGMGEGEGGGGGGGDVPIFSWWSMPFLLAALYYVIRRSEQYTSHKYSE